MLNNLATSRKSPFWKLLIGLAVLLTVGGLLFFGHSGSQKNYLSPIVLVGAQPAIDYGGSTSCKECHEQAYNLWAKSHHGLAQRLPEMLRDGAGFVPARTLKHGTQQTAFAETNGRFEIITAGLGGTNQVFPVAEILANHPLRQMLIPFPGGRLQATEAAWDPRSNEWFNVYGDEDRKPGEWGHWTGRGMNWNSMCAYCHNTALQKNYDAKSDSYATASVERGVGCESCHGPLKAHNDWQHAHRGQRLKDPTLPKFSRDQMIDACAACHSRRGEISDHFKVGDSYWDNYFLTIVDDSDTFYPDGQIRDEDYEFTAFLGSRMYHKGVRCMDCHDVHTMKPKLVGNALCLTCHGPGMTNAPSIDPVKHSHHKVFGYDTNGVPELTEFAAARPAQIKETGGECVNCHMPQTPYMVRHWRHDHGFTIPDPLLTKKFGIPNACQRCHADKDADWNLKYVEQWYGTNMNRPYRQRAETIAHAKQSDVEVLSALLNMAASDEIFYWRAVATGLLQRWNNDPSVSAALIERLRDTNALVRRMAVQSLGTSGRPDALAALPSLLNDPVRSVRVETARQLVGTLDTNSLAGREYSGFLQHNADQPLGQMALAVYEWQRGNPTNGLKHFQTAVEWDAYSPGIHHELAMAYSQLGQAEAAVKALQRAVELAPREAEYHYKLALAYNEAGQREKVLSELESAVKLDPRHARAAYNLGLARNAAGDSRGSIQTLLQAEAAAPTDWMIPYARATIHARLGEIKEARQAARRAVELNPDGVQPAELLQQLGDAGAK